MKQEQTLYCSFCGLTQYEVSVLVAGPSSFICSECVDLCKEICDDRRTEIAKQEAQGAPHDH